MEKKIKCQGQRTIQSRAVKRAMNLPNILESTSQEEQDTEQLTSSQAQPNQMRRNREQQHECGTCTFRNSSCVNLVEESTPDKRFARGAEISFQES